MKHLGPLNTFKFREFFLQPLFCCQLQFVAKVRTKDYLSFRMRVCMLLYETINI
jgi:hypothetical protein